MDSTLAQETKLGLTFSSCKAGESATPFPKKVTLDTTRRLLGRSLGALIEQTPGSPTESTKRVGK